MQLPSATKRATELFEANLPVDPAVTTRKMFGQPAAFYRGKMFFGVFGDGVVLRLPMAERDQALQLPGVLPFEPMAGRPMRDWVQLPSKLLEDRSTAAIWVQKALQHAASLSPAIGRAASKGSRPRRKR